MFRGKKLAGMKSMLFSLLRGSERVEVTLEELEAIANILELFSGFTALSVKHRKAKISLTLSPPLNYVNLLVVVQRKWFEAK